MRGRAFELRSEPIGVVTTTIREMKLAPLHLATAPKTGHTADRSVLLTR